jgi:DNA-binding transcriptional LysR family regulator
VRYFVAVAENLSFRQAGKQLHVSQPSLSVQIKQLEDELGVALFRRSKRRVEITRAGDVFFVCGTDGVFVAPTGMCRRQRIEHGRFRLV